MFLRWKDLKNKNGVSKGAYIVETVMNDGKVQQKVIKYIGCIPVEKMNDPLQKELLRLKFGKVLIELTGVDSATKKRLIEKFNSLIVPDASFEEVYELRNITV